MPIGPVNPQFTRFKTGLNALEMQLPAQIKELETRAHDRKLSPKTGRPS